jgi:two-component system sensor histidine kinase MprB
VSLRTRIALAAALAVIVAFGVGGFVTYQAAQSSLYGEVDASLRAAALREGDAALRPDRANPDRGFGGNANGRFGAPGIFAELIDDTGEIVRLPRNETPLPTTQNAAEIAKTGGSEYETFVVDGSTIRALTVNIQPNLALQVARSVDEIQASLDRLRSLLLLAGIGGVIFAIILGALVAERGLVPLRRLATDVEGAARDRDLSHRVPEQGGAESVRLALAVNALLAGLEEARLAQDQLVADAAHELRTPLTALRADVETLGNPQSALSVEDRQQLAVALDREIDEISQLITSIVDLARGARPVEQSEPLQLDDLAADVVARARSRRPEAVIELDTEVSPFVGDPVRLERALGNLVENALLHGSSPVTVTVRPALITVDDSGRGIPLADREAMFERFRRGVGVQDRPGSGLGLAIVRQDIAAHGGSVEIGDAPTGGCRFTIHLPYR